jgi:hypothetical protein
MKVGGLVATLVNVDNFASAETARMFDNILALAGGVNRWYHYREPTPLDRQPVIRMNRDTLYSTAIVDIRQGAELTLPDADGRYMTVMVVNEDHYVNLVLSGAGTYQLDMDEHGTPFVSLAIRTFVDPNDPDDISEVNALQDAVELNAGSEGPYTHPEYDPATLDGTREPLLRLAEGVSDADGMFGKREDVDPVRHLIGTALGWGGLPVNEAFYYTEATPRPVGHYTLLLESVPVDAFWSIAIYNKDGYFEANPYNSFGLNSITATPDERGRVTLNLAPEPGDLTNHAYIMDGWNYVLRLYKPQAPVLDKTWTPPSPVTVV